MAKPRPLELTDDRKPWHRLKGETEERHTWFVRYLEMGLPRSIKRLAQQRDASADYLYQLSSTGLWEERCRLFDEDGQTQWDREVSLKQRKAHATITDLTANLTARCLAHAAGVVGQLSPDKAVARAFDGARTVHALTGPQTPAVQVNATAHAAAGAQASADAGASPAEDAAHGRDADLYAEILGVIRNDVQAEAQRGAQEGGETAPEPEETGPVIRANPELTALIDSLDGDDEDDGAW